MRIVVSLVILLAIVGGAAYWWLSPPPRGVLTPAGELDGLLAEAAAEDGPPGPDAAAEERGEYVFTAAGCGSCHTVEDGPALGGGVALETAFGTFYGPNITPDPAHGIGGWSEADLATALRQGVSPGGAPYYPVLPFNHYAGMSDGDVADLWAYLQTVEPVAEASPPHDLAWPYSWRIFMRPWRWLYFQPGGAEIAQDQPDLWRRGAYLVETLGHCGACHTPRTSLGALDHSRTFAGAPNPVGDGSIPNITPSEDGLAGWSVDDIVLLLEIGMTPTGDFLGGEMADVVNHSTGRLSARDRQAIAVYLLALEPIASQ